MFRLGTLCSRGGRSILLAEGIGLSTVVRTGSAAGYFPNPPWAEIERPLTSFLYTDDPLSGIGDVDPGIFVHTCLAKHFLIEQEEPVELGGDIVAIAKYYTVIADFEVRARRVFAGVISICATCAVQKLSPGG